MYAFMVLFLIGVYEFLNTATTTVSGGDTATTTSGSAADHVLVGSDVPVHKGDFTDADAGSGGSGAAPTARSGGVFSKPKIKDRVAVGLGDVVVPVKAADVASSSGGKQEGPVGSGSRKSALKDKEAAVRAK